MPASRPPSSSCRSAATTRSAFGGRWRPRRRLSYDFVLLDCPPFLGAITTNALSAADLAIIPTQAEYFSAYALRNMMGMIRRVRQESNPGLGYRILITLLRPPQSHPSQHPGTAAS